MTTQTVASSLRCLALFALFSLAAACDYSTEVKKSVQRVLRQDFASYHFFATPAGNFGIGTMYLKSANAQKPSEIAGEALIAIPETYFTTDLPPAERAELLKRLFPDGKIGKFSVNEKLVQGVALDVAVPGIAGAISAGGKVDFKKGVEVELQAGETAVRRLNWTELARARKDGKIADDIALRLDARDVMIAMNDIVIRGYTAVVKIDATVNANLKAELDKAAQGKPVDLPSGTTSFSTGQNGTYRIEVNDPVIVAILFKEIPVGVLAAADSDAWPATPVPGDVASQLRGLVARLRAKIK